MPLLKFIAIAGSVLLALLFVADAMLTSPKHPVYASKFDLKPPAWLTNTDGHIVTTDLQPAAPHIAEIPKETSETTGAATAAQAKAPSAEMQKAEIRKKKPRAAHRRTKPQPSATPWTDPDPWNAFAYAPSGRKTGHKSDRRSDPTPYWFR